MAAVSGNSTFATHRLLAGPSPRGASCIFAASMLRGFSEGFRGTDMKSGVPQNVVCSGLPEACPLAPSWRRAVEHLYASGPMRHVWVGRSEASSFFPESLQQEPAQQQSGNKPGSLRKDPATRMRVKYMEVSQACGGRPTRVVCVTGEDMIGRRESSKPDASVVSERRLRRCPLGFAPEASACATLCGSPSVSASRASCFRRNGPPQPLDRPKIDRGTPTQDRPPGSTTKQLQLAPPPPNPRS